MVHKLLIQGLLKPPYTDGVSEASEDAIAELGDKVKKSGYKKLGKSLAIRMVDAGSCNACELEINALSNAYYDIERFGIHFVASPRHADILLVTGSVTANMREALERTYNAMPSPKWVIASGECAVNGGRFAKSYACIGAVSNVLDVDITIKGCPPNPTQLLQGILALLESR